MLSSCKPNIYVSWSTSEIRVILVPSNIIMPFSNSHTDYSKAVLFFHFCHLCFIISFVILFLADLWCYVFLSEFVTFPGSGVVLDCIDFWSSSSLLLSCYFLYLFKWYCYVYQKVQESDSIYITDDLLDVFINCVNAD